MRTGIISLTRITRALGRGNSSLSIISSAALALTSFFYIYTLGTYFRVNIYILQNRVTYHTFFDFYVIDKYADHIIIVSGIVLWLALSISGRGRFAFPAIYAGITIIAVAAGLNVVLDILALISIPIVTSFLVYNRFTTKRKLLNMHTSSLSLNYLAIIGVVIGILSIIAFSLPSLFSIPLETIPIRNYAYDIFLFFSSFSPVLMLLLILCFPIKVLMKEFIVGILKIKNNKIDSLLSNDSIKSRTKIIYLSLFMLLSVTMVLIPHQPTINKDNQQYVGTDTGHYVNWVNNLMQSKDAQEFVRQAFIIQQHGDRPLALIFLFTIVKILNVDPSYTIEHAPVILGPVLVLVIYFLTRELTSNNDKISLLASFLTAVSFQTLIGIYAGFYANWFALIIGYSSFVFLFRFLRASNRLNFAIYSALIIILLFSHVYTWSIFMMVIVIFLAAMLKLSYYSKKSIILLLLVVLSSVVIDVARMTITGSVSGIEEQIKIASLTGVGLTQFALRWSNLIDATQNYYGSQFSNSIVLMLGLYWLFRCNLREPSTILLIVFLSMGVVPLFFGDWLVQSRVLYNIPLQIPAAFGLAYIKKQANGTIILLPICIWLIAISIRAVSNFYLILPS
jgi:hypothetical protein